MIIVIIKLDIIQSEIRVPFHPPTTSVLHLLDCVALCVCRMVFVLRLLYFFYYLLLQCHLSRQGGMEFRRRVKQLHTLMHHECHEY